MPEVLGEVIWSNQNLRHNYEGYLALWKQQDRINIMTLIFPLRDKLSGLFYFLERVYDRNIQPHTDMGRQDTVGSVLKADYILTIWYTVLCSVSRVYLKRSGLMHILRSMHPSGRMYLHQTRRKPRTSAGSRVALWGTRAYCKILR